MRRRLQRISPLARASFAAGSTMNAIPVTLSPSCPYMCGPMSGFDAAALDAAFWAGTTVRSNFICTLGHGDPAKVLPRSPRLSFEEACQLV